MPDDPLRSRRAPRSGPAPAPRDGTLRSRRVAVVGGGVSGLVAARELARAGAEVTVLEAEDRAGGRIRGVRLGDDAGGAMIDIGAEAFATRNGAVAALVAELGLADDIVRPAALGSWVIAGDRAVRLPAAGSLGIPHAPLSRDSRRALGASGALRAAIEPLLPRSLGRNADSLGALVRARLGARVHDRLVRPVALGVHSTEPSKLAVDAVPGLGAAFARRGSLIAAARELRDSRTAAGGAVSGLRGGMTALVDALLADLARRGATVRTGARVERLERRQGADDTGWALTFAEDAMHADAVVLAVPERAARDLLDAARGGTGGTPGVASDLGRTATRSDAAAGSRPARVDRLDTRVEVVALALADPRLDRAPRGTGALVAEAGHGEQSGPILAKALTHVTAKWPSRAAERPAGQHVIRLSYGRADTPPETAGMSDEAARRIALRDASRILGIELRAESVLGMARQEWRNGLPPSPGRTIAAPSGIVCAGDWVSGTGLASVVPGARAAVDRLSADLIGSPAEPGSLAEPGSPAEIAASPESGSGSGTAGRTPEQASAHQKDHEGIPHA